MLCLFLAAILIGCGSMNNVSRTEDSGAIGQANVQARISRHKKPPPPPPPPPPATSWDILSYGTTVTANAGPPGVMYFNFPAAGSNYPKCNANDSCISVNYVTEPYTGAASKSISMTFEITSTGSPVFNYQTESYNTCVTPATARLYFERKGDNGTADYYRWWANPTSYTLAATNGVVTMTVSLTPDQWSSVYGDFGNSSSAALAGFQAALANLEDVGFTLGGGCFFGHGVNVSGGTAQFIVDSFTVQ